MVLGSAFFSCLSMTIAGIEVDALRGLLLGTPRHLASDFAVLFVAAALGVTAAPALLGRPAR